MAVVFRGFDSGDGAWSIDPGDLALIQRLERERGMRVDPRILAMPAAGMTFQHFLFLLSCRQGG